MFGIQCNDTIDGSLEEVGRPIFVVTHPRSGTHLAIDLLRKQFEACRGWLWFGETLHHLYLMLDNFSTEKPRDMSPEEAISILRRADRPIVKTHELPDFRTYSEVGHDFAHRLFKRADHIYVVRDGRDVLCSAYLWLCELHGRESQGTISEFLRQEVEGRSRVKYWAEHVWAWAGISDVHVIQFEDILQRPRSIIEELGEALNLSPLFEAPYLPERKASLSRWVDYWRRLTRDFESTAVAGRPDSQGRLDWRDVFSTEDRRFFWKEAGDLLVEFGYEADRSWITE